jgi:hypothetical protein
MAPSRSLGRGPRFVASLASLFQNKTMIASIIFLLSGLMIVFLIHAKMIETKNQKKPAILRFVSMGDEHVRTLSVEVAHRYTDLKGRAEFFINKQFPMHARNFVNKTNAVIKERVEKHVGDIRGSKFLKKSDGLSEFFKSLSEKETNGRIEEEGEETRQ